jgi:hypothetical protein
MTRTEDLSGFEQRLMGPLLDLVHEQRRDAVLRPAAAVPLRSGRRRRSLRAGVGVAGAVVLALVAVVVPAQRGGSEAFAVTRLPDGRIEISVQEDFDDAAALEAEVLAAGVAVEVEQVPASPSMVGKVAQAEFLDPATGQFGEAGLFTQNASFAPFEEELIVDPSTVSDVLHLQVGVAAAPGEPYAERARGSVFAPGEVLDGLHCVLGDGPHTVGELAPYLEGLGVRVTWFDWNAQPGEEYGLQEQAGLPPADDTVSGVEQVSGEEVHVYADWDEVHAQGEPVAIGPDGTVMTSAELPTHSQRFPCTPELAARWH